MTLRTALDRVVRQMEADGKSSLTIQVYRAELERFAEYAGSRKSVHEFRPDTLARYFTEPSVRMTPDGKPRSARTMNRTKAALRSLFRYLHDTGTITRDPTRVLKNARTDRTIPTVMTAEETVRFVKALKAGANDALGRRDQVLFTLLLRSGMRLGAALALDIADLDLAGCCATSHGKHSRVQRVYFPKDVGKMVARHVRAEGITEGALFRGCRGRLSIRQSQYRFRKALAAAGIDRALTVHSLRHTFATRLQDETGDLRLVQVALGHRQLSTTQVYATVQESRVRAAIGLGAL